ncbi:MAG: PQQ-binding-like beta-propeller repeat protein, partial [Acidobacteriota bacterium]|nr:PQQ-binding-like beta-propeller repeat protein [Acidobacteriota bacterium]
SDPRAADAPNGPTPDGAAGSEVAPEPAAETAPESQPATRAAEEPVDATRSSPAQRTSSEPERIVGAERPGMGERDVERVEWPGFRGPDRDGVVHGARIRTDWARQAPVELWRHRIGPGWSSFAVSGDFIYTQEQRGEDEMVSCYRLSTGEPVWQHRDAIRFWESNGGAGPRATPTLSHGRVYAMGATGVVNALDGATGAVLWSRNAATDADKQVPDWGIAGSPLVIDDLVIIAVAGRLVAYDVATGDLRWLGEAGGGGYSSPHLATIAGVPQVLLLRGARTISVTPADGTLLWEHRWQPAVSIVQPAIGADGSVLIASGDAMGGMGMRRIAVAHDEGGWHVEERWTSRGLKPYFNDFVVHRGNAFGFDGSILSCIDLETGERVWKGGRYGNGQLVLLPNQDLLLVLSEDGELALVSATPDTFREIARIPALDGKTWNHPVLVGDTLLVRNGEEMAAFRLSLADR